MKLYYTNVPTKATRHLREVIRTQFTSLLHKERPSCPQFLSEFKDLTRIAVFATLQNTHHMDIVKYYCSCNNLPYASFKHKILTYFFNKSPVPTPAFSEAEEKIFNDFLLQFAYNMLKEVEEIEIKSFKLHNNDYVTTYLIYLIRSRLESRGFNCIDVSFNILLEYIKKLYLKSTNQFCPDKQLLNFSTLEIPNHIKLIICNNSKKQIAEHEVRNFILDIIYNAYIEINYHKLYNEELQRNYTYHVNFAITKCLRDSNLTFESENFFIIYNLFFKLCVAETSNKKIKNVISNNEKAFQLFSGKSTPDDIVDFVQKYYINNINPILY